MVESESDFCELYADRKKCHDVEHLNCYLCACPLFRFNSNGIEKIDDKTAFSYCKVNSKFGHQGVFGDEIHQDCSQCTVPHSKKYVLRNYDNWFSVMASCDVSLLLIDGQKEISMNLLEKSDEEIFNEITPIMDNMMEGSTEINHAKHTRDFTDRMKAIVTPENLQCMCKDYQARWGLFGKREFVALFRRKHSIAVVWKQYCSNSTDEHVADVVFVEHDNRLLIDHAMVY